MLQCYSYEGAELIPVPGVRAAVAIAGRQCWTSKRYSKPCSSADKCQWACSNSHCRAEHWMPGCACQGVQTGRQNSYSISVLNRHLKGAATRPTGQSYPRLLMWHFVRSHPPW
jgi:hypothetical protein